jgi:predicted esterase YcpF (UPF0227 family)
MSPAPPITHLLYLHGFRSSPQSAKAQHMAAVMAQKHPQVQWWCPQLPPSPREAAACLADGTRDWPDSSAVIGSSLGGFYATWLLAQRPWRGVLINPAVFPARDLARYIGQQTSWHNPQDRFFFEPHFVSELQALEVGVLTAPERVLAFIAQGDEVLDWREMSARYPGAQQVVMAGGDHALSNFPDLVPQVETFFGLTPPTP